MKRIYIYKSGITNVYPCLGPNQRSLYCCVCVWVYIYLSLSIYFSLCAPQQQCIVIYIHTTTTKSQIYIQYLCGQPNQLIVNRKKYIYNNKINIYRPTARSIARPPDPTDQLPARLPVCCPTIKCKCTV